MEEVPENETSEDGDSLNLSDENKDVLEQLEQEKEKKVKVKEKKGKNKRKARRSRQRKRSGGYVHSTR